MSEMVTLTVIRNPLRPGKREMLSCTPGTSLRCMVRRAGLVHPRVDIGGMHLPESMWDHAYPRPGVPVVVTETPDGVESALYAFFLEVFAFLGPTGAKVAAVVSTGVTLVGVSAGLSFAVNSLVQSSLGSGDRDGIIGGSESPALRGVGNEIRPLAPIPELFGRNLVFPPLGGQPFTEIVGNHTYVRALYLISKGEIQVDNPGQDILLGELPISEMSGATWQLRTGEIGADPIQIYTRQAEQRNISVPFETALFNAASTTSDWQTFRTSGDVDEVAIEFSHQALFRINESGSSRSFVFDVEVQFRLADTSDPWLDAVAATDFSGAEASGAVTVSGTRLNYNAAVQVPFLTGFSWRVPVQGQYDIRVRRVDDAGARNNLPGGADSSATVASFTWRALKGFRDDSPILPDAEGISTLAVRIRLDDQTGGFIQRLSIKSTRKLSVYDPGDALGLGIDSNGWTVGTAATRNPAAAYLHIFRGMLATPLEDARIDYDSINAFYTNCDTDGYKYDQYVDFESLASDLASTIAKSGFAAHDIDRSGLVTVIEDRIKSSAVQAVTAHNSRGLTIQRSYPSEVHAVRIAFQNEEEGYEPNSEVIAYDDGFSADGAGDTQIASKFIEISLSGIVEPSRAWMHGRRALAENRLRPRRYIVEMDVENLVAQRGDLVILNHQDALIGLGSGRVVDFSSSVVSQAESTAGWTGQINNSVISNTVDPYQGSANVKTEATGVTAQLGARYNPLGTWDFSEKMISFWVRLSQEAWDQLSFTSGFVVRLDDGADEDDWEVGKLQIPAPNAWFRVVVDVENETPSDDGGASHSSVDELRFWVNGSFNLGDGSTFEIDDVRILDPQILIVDEYITFEWDKSYSMQFRTIDDTDSSQYEIVEVEVTNPLASFDDPLATTAITLSEIPSFFPKPGDLFMFGESSAVSLDAIVDKVDRVSAHRARIELVDYAPAVFDSVASIPEFTSGTTSPVPIGFRNPGQPIILEVVTDERALARSNTGTLIPTARILLSGDQDPTRPPTETYQVQVRRSMLPDPDSAGFLNVLEPWQVRPIEFTSARVIVVQDLDEGTYYDIRVRGVSPDGRTSRWAIESDVQVTGKTNPPPDVLNPRVENGNLWWDIAFQPIDLAGYRVRVAEGNNTSWEQGSPLSPNDIPGPPFPISSIPSGTKTFMIRAIDTSRNLSLNTAFVTRDLGDLLTDNVIRTQDEHSAGFLGPKNMSEVDLGDLVNEEVGVAFWSNPASPFWSGVPASTFWGSSTYLEGTYVTNFEVVAADLPGAIFTDILVVGGYRAEFRNVFHLEDAESTTGWVLGGLGGTQPPTLDNTNFIEGAGSIYTDSNGSLFPTGLEIPPISPALDLQNLWLEFYIRLESADVEGGAGLELGIWDADSTFVAMDIVNDDLTSLGDDWYFVRIKPSVRAPSEIDYGTVSRIRLRTNVQTPTSSTAFMNLDRISISGDWNTWPGRLDDPEVGLYDFRLTLFGGSSEVRVSGYDISIDAPDIVENVDAFELAGAAAERIPITRTYRAITNVNLTLFDNGSGAVTALKLDNGTGGPPLTGGPEIETLNDSGINVAGRVDAIIQGY